MLGSGVDFSYLAIRLPEAKVTGTRILFDQLQEKDFSRAIEVNTLQQERGHIEHFGTSNPMWKLVSLPIDTLRRYTDECASCVNCPALEVWQAFLGSTKEFPLVCRLSQPDQRLSTTLDVGVETIGRKVPIVSRPFSPQETLFGCLPMRPWDT